MMNTGIVNVGSDNNRQTFSCKKMQQHVVMIKQLPSKPNFMHRYQYRSRQPLTTELQ